MIREFPNLIIVDIDTNEIFGDSYYEPYSPPNINENNINIGKGMIQGKNYVTVDGSYLYKLEKGENNYKKVKLHFEEKNNIIVDSQKCQMLIDRTDIFVNSKERKWLRRNIQLIRNPEILKYIVEKICTKKDEKFETKDIEYTEEQEGYKLVLNELENRKNMK